jgi:hypothetical protein
MTGKYPVADVYRVPVLAFSKQDHRNAAVFPWNAGMEQRSCKKSLYILWRERVEERERSGRWKFGDVGN